jgi:murein DD-endopeptidase MepM/ murein hydrolase activator NlpD
MRDRVPGSPLVGMGQVFVAQAGRAGLDPRVLVAIAFHESALGTLGAGADRYNPFGLGPGIRYPSWERSITVAADTLANGYIAEGRTTLAAIAAKWAPVGAANDPSGLNSHWVRGVGAAYGDLGGDPAGSVLVGADSAEVCGPGPLLAGGSVPLPMRVAPQVIGAPNAPGSTHDPHVSPDNWQSDNAIDFAMPEGTPLTAVCGGVIGPQLGTLDPSPASRFGGMRLTIRCDEGPSWYYAHLATIAPALAPGVRVQVGQPVGTSGVANTVAHLHVAVDGGDPMVLFGLQQGGG